MTQKYILPSFLLFFTLVMVSACYKDKGNYVYHPIGQPVITNLDTVYNVFVGDSLVIAPNISIPGSTGKLGFLWNISDPDSTLTGLNYAGPSLRMIFGLGPERYSTRLTIIDSSNMMEYFQDFIISGQTAFSMGTTVLTLENGITQLSFIKPNDSVQPRIFQAVNPSQALPLNPTQILAVPQAYQPNILTYWVFGMGGPHTGVQIDANTFQKKENLADNFFNAPDTALIPYNMFVDPLGVISGNINGTLYSGTTETWNEAPTYGMFDDGAAGNYRLSPQVVFNYSGTYGPGNFIGFDENQKQFVRFNLYGGIVFFGPAYTVLDTIVDPTNLGMDIQHLQQINGGLCYAYCKGASDTLYEMKFDAEFNGPFTFQTYWLRPFMRPDLITASTLWQATPNEIIYFTNADKIYRYNPINQQITTLSNDFGGQPVTMIKVSADGNTLYAGVNGSLYYLNISTGNYGTLIKRIDGLPGTVIDLAIRNS